MSRKKPLDTLYLQFLNQAHTMPDAIALYAVEQKLLNLVAQNHAAQAPLNVIDLLEYKTIASPSTLHKRLTRLRKAELVAIKPVAHDYPRKAVELTGKSIEYFNALSKSMRYVMQKKQ